MRLRGGKRSKLNGQDGQKENPDGISNLKAIEKRYVSSRVTEDIEGKREQIISGMKAMLDAEIKKLQIMPNRAKSMGYFDSIAQFFGRRAEELQEFKNNGGKVVGSLCMFAPTEIIAASGALPIRFCSGFHEPTGPANVILGDAGLCPLVKSTLGLKMASASPYLNMCDLLIAPTPCDAKLKLGEILQDYLPVLLINVPKVKAGAVNRKQWIEEIGIIMDKLELLTGKKIKKADLKKSINMYQRAYSAYRELISLRKEADVLWGRDTLMIAQLSYYDDIERWTDNLLKLIEELKIMKQEGKRVAEPDAPRILLAGSPIIWPNWKIPDIIEESGGLIVADELCSATRALSNPVVVDEYTQSGMIDAVADRYLYPCTCPCFSPNIERDDDLKNRIKDYKVDGVIFHVLKGCHLNALDATRIKRILEEANIPMFTIESEYVMGDYQQIKLRLEAFMEMVRAQDVF
ncbi:MAG: 2-hydroxyacyl-CoA dehydratase [Thermoplasmata archaeon]|nr:MAG: 2-hydroxyacyl-CoA dehydratase [Thermoplasmata archaeon]